MAFPEDPQSVYVDLPLDVTIGDFWEGDNLNQITARGFIANKTKVSQVTTCTVVPNNGDLLSVVIDGALVPPITSTADATATALLLEAAIEGVAALAGVIAGVEATGADFAINFSDFLVHTVVAHSPATADITPIVTAPDAVNQALLNFGDAVVHDTTVVTASGTPITALSAIGQTILAVIGRMPGNEITPEMLRLQGYDVDHLQPARAYPLTTEKGGIVVAFFGTAPAVGDPVFAQPGLNGTMTTYGVTDGAVSQVTQGDVEFVGVEVVGLAVDALPDLTVASDTSDDITAAALRDAWNASAQHAGVAAATIDTSGAESLIILSFADDQAHTVVAVSPAAADVVAIVNTATAVAAFARALPNSSWGRPTNTATTPPQAYLRVDVRAN